MWYGMTTTRLVLETGLPWGSGLSRGCMTTVWPRTMCVRFGLVPHERYSTGDSYVLPSMRIVGNTSVRLRVMQRPEQRRLGRTWRSLRVGCCQIRENSRPQRYQP
eukprot:9261682-Pyramimonas_sp.AAC.1